MAIDISLENLIRLSAVPKLKCMPTGKDGKRISLATIYRWALGGTGGIKLETLKVGGSLCTSLEALQRFFEALSNNGTGAFQATTSEMPHESARRRREIEEATRRLDVILYGKKGRPSNDSKEMAARMAEARKRSPFLASLSPQHLRDHLEAERRLDEAGI
jgi:hypothetical protein